MSAFAHSQIDSLLSALPVEALRKISAGMNAQPTADRGHAGIGAQLSAALDPAPFMDAPDASPKPPPSRRGHRKDSSPPTLSRSEQARVNGAKSRGPVTDDGKDRSRQNALRHGLRAEGLLTPDEDPAEYAAFIDDYRRELRAVGTVQIGLAERAAQMAWKLKHIPIIETQVYAVRRETRGDPDLGLGAMGDLIYELIGADDDDGAFNRLQRYEGRIERSLRMCLRELRLLQGQATAEDRAAAARSARSSGAPGSFGALHVGSALRTEARTKGVGTWEDGAVPVRNADPTDHTPGSFGALCDAPVSEVLRRPGCSVNDDKNPGLREYAQTPPSSSTPAPGSFGAIASLVPSGEVRINEP